MKKKFIFALSSMLLLAGPLTLMTSCKGDDPKPQPQPGPGPVDEGTVASFTCTKSLSGNISVGEEITIVVKAYDADRKEVSDAKFTFIPDDESIISEVALDTGKFVAKKTGTANITVTCLDGVAGLAEQTVSVTIGNLEGNAEGAYNYVGKTYEEKLEILGKLEDYAVKNHLTGMTLFQSGGYVMYNPRIKKATNNYITGYGFGILTEGEILSPMENESNENWKMYYHSYGGNSNKGKFNYLDDTGSESADLYGYVSSTLYGTKMNATKDGYDYYPLLAKPNPEATTEKEKVRPIALNLDPTTNLASKFRIYVRTGDDGVVYNSLSNRKYNFTGATGRVYEDYSFAGRPVEVEDYITPYRLLLNQAISLNRSTDMISDNSDTTLKGAKAYYAATKNDSNIYRTKEIFNKLVGIKSGKDANGAYLDFELNKSITTFDAMNGLSSTLVSPIPEDFVRAISPTTNEDEIYKQGMKQAYGITSHIGNVDYSPVDNLLSIAPYVLEQSNAGTAGIIAYKRNPLWFEFNPEYQPDPTINSRYKIPGIKIAYFDSSTNLNAVFDAFIQAGTLDAASLPKDYIAQYKDDARTTTTQGDSTFKLNMNTATQEEWNKMFLDPTKKTYNGGQSYNCKPLMSNGNFVDALSYALDRKTFAENRGSIPSQSYFAPAYLWDPEEGKSYDETAQHKAVLADASPATYGYNKEMAVKLFDQAIKEEVENKGNYGGSYASSETIRIEWMNTSDAKEYGNEIAKYFQDAFELTDAYAKGFRINWEQGEGNQDYQVVYNTMRSGKFDLGFGSISGMTNDPLGFLEVLKSDNSSGFTLNYGVDTAVVRNGDNGSIIYDGKRWSFDSLWAASKNGAIVGSDTKVVAEPIKFIASSGSVADSIRLDGDQIDVRKMAIEIEQASEAAAATFRFFNGASAIETAEVTFTISYGVGEDNVPAVAVYSVKMNSPLVDVIEVINEDGTILSEDARMYVYVPTTITSKVCESLGEGETIAWNKITGITVSLTSYMEINGIPVGSTVSVDMNK